MRNEIVADSDAPFFRKDTAVGITPHEQRDCVKTIV